MAGALGWIFVAEAVRLKWRTLLRTAVRLIVAGGLIMALFVALSPALWNDPVARVGDLLTARADLLHLQVKVDSRAPLTFSQRVKAIISQPFMTPLQHFEVASWATYQPITDQITDYMKSPFSGVQFGSIFGGLLTLLAGVGILFAGRRDWRAGLLIWLAISAAALLINPLPWQRYYLALIPVWTLLAGIGLFGLIERFVWKPEQHAAAQ